MHIQHLHGEWAFYIWRNLWSQVGALRKLFQYLFSASLGYAHVSRSVAAQHSSYHGYNINVIPICTPLFLMHVCSVVLSWMLVHRHSDYWVECIFGREVLNYKLVAFFIILFLCCEESIDYDNHFIMVHSNLFFNRPCYLSN